MLEGHAYVCCSTCRGLLSRALHSADDESHRKVDWSLVQMAAVTMSVISGRQFSDMPACRKGTACLQNHCIYHPLPCMSSGAMPDAAGKMRCWLQRGLRKMSCQFRNHAAEHDAAHHARKHLCVVARPPIQRHTRNELPADERAPHR